MARTAYTASRSMNDRMAPDPGERLPDRRGGQRLATGEDPHAALFPELRRAAHRPQSDPIVAALQHQLVARNKSQFFPHCLWKDNSAQLIYRQRGNHVRTARQPFGRALRALEMGREPVAGEIGGPRSPAAISSSFWTI